MIILTSHAKTDTPRVTESLLARHPWWGGFYTAIADTEAKPRWAWRSEESSRHRGEAEVGMAARKAADTEAKPRWAWRSEEKQPTPRRSRGGHGGEEKQPTSGRSRGGHGGEESSRHRGEAEVGMAKNWGVVKIGWTRSG